MRSGIISTQPVGQQSFQSPAIQADVPITTTIISLILVCLPTLFFLSLLGKTACEKRRSTVLKKQITKLEQIWRINYQHDIRSGD